MSIFDKTLDGRSLYDIAIETIRHYARSDGKNLVAFSGGKDSQVVLQLCKEAGVTYLAQYSITRFEPPELLDFLKEHYPEVAIRRAYKKPLLAEIEYRGLPSRWTRWCCAAKHVATPGYPMAFIGVRGEESARRRDTWRTFGRKKDGTYFCCPIFHWTTENVWEFLDSRGLPHCKLYDEGHRRIGCVLCPLVSSPTIRQRDATKWPKTAAMLRRGAEKFCARMAAQGYVTKRGKQCPDWRCAANPSEEYFRRWAETGQTSLSVAEYAARFGSGGNGDLPGQCVFGGSGFSEGDAGAEGDGD